MSTRVKKKDASCVIVNLENKTMIIEFTIVWNVIWTAVSAGWSVKVSRSAFSLGGENLKCGNGRVHIKRWVPYPEEREMTVNIMGKLEAAQPKTESRGWYHRQHWEHSGDSSDNTHRRPNRENKRGNEERTREFDCDTKVCALPKKNHTRAQFKRTMPSPSKNGGDHNSHSLSLWLLSITGAKAGCSQNG